MDKELTRIARRVFRDSPYRVIGVSTTHDTCRVLYYRVRPEPEDPDKVAYDGDLFMHLEDALMGHTDKKIVILNDDELDDDDYIEDQESVSDH